LKLEDFIQAIRKGKIRITDHAYEEAHNDDLTFDEIFTSVIQGEIIKDYPEDKPYPRCLIFGENFERESIHSVWAYNKKNQWAVLITVYRPDPDKWINGKIRRP
jgi:hypothetical protein